MKDSLQKACVIVNFGDTAEKVKVNFTNVKGKPNVDILQPFQKDQFGSLPEEITIPPRTCTVVVQK
jgi:hypothetical protein